MVPTWPPSCAIDTGPGSPAPVPGSSGSAPVHDMVVAPTDEGRSVAAEGTVDDRDTEVVEDVAAAVASDLERCPGAGARGSRWGSEPDSLLGRHSFPEVAVAVADAAASDSPPVKTLSGLVLAASSSGLVLAAAAPSGLVLAAAASSGPSPAAACEQSEPAYDMSGPGEELASQRWRRKRSPSDNSRPGQNSAGFAGSAGRRGPPSRLGIDARMDLLWRAAISHVSQERYREPWTSEFGRHTNNRKATIAKARPKRTAEYRARVCGRPTWSGRCRLTVSSPNPTNQRLWECSEQAVMNSKESLSLSLSSRAFTA